MRNFIIGAIVMATTAVSVGETTSVLLVENGQPWVTIVVPDNAENLKLAIDELNYHFKIASGCSLSLVKEKDAEPVSGNLLLLGDSALTRALGIKTGDLPPVLIGDLTALQVRKSGSRK